jgi:D-alanine transaminase
MAMAKMEALRVGCDDAWLVQNGVVTEGTSKNAGIILGGSLITHQLGSDILLDITRSAILDCAKQMNLHVEERAFSVSGAQSASEAFITSSMNFAVPVVEIDGVVIGSGAPGPVVS